MGHLGACSFSSFSIRSEMMAWRVCMTQIPEIGVVSLWRRLSGCVSSALPHISDLSQYA